MKIIGLTGGSGSGKSTVAGILAELGGYVIDADELAHKVMECGERGYGEIVEYFGTEVLDREGCIDRKRLGTIVWSDREKLNRLMEITHKYVIEETFEQIAEVREAPGKYRFIVVDAPLLVEAGMHKRMDKVWLVDARRELRLQRIMDRDGIDREAAEARLRNQTSSDELRKYADVIFENNADLQVMKEHIVNVLRLFIEEA